MTDNREFATRAVHAGHTDTAGAVVGPIFQTAMFRYGTDDAPDEVIYARDQTTPTHTTVERRIASLENAEDATVAASGIAAVSIAILSKLESGDHLIALDSLYGGSVSLFNEQLPRLGIETTYVPIDDPGAWKAALRPNTRAFWAEPITNPLIRVPDLPGIVAFCREHNLASMIDATFTSPVLYRPLDHGFDLVVHSATKYLNGHSDIIAGAVAGSQADIESCRRRVHHLGASLDAHAAFLLERGIKTLPLRVRRACDSAQQIAEALAGDGIAVNYPGLPSHPGHAMATELFDNAYGGMLSFDVGSTAAAHRFMNALLTIVPALSLGGVESIATISAQTSHTAFTREERYKMGVTDGLVRLSVGIEDPADLIADIRGAMR